MNSFRCYWVLVVVFVTLGHDISFSFSGGFISLLLVVLDEILTVRADQILWGFT